MARSQEVLRLQEELAAATSAFTALLHGQFLAVVSGDPDVARFDARIAEAHEARKRTMHALLDHVRTYGW